MTFPVPICRSVPPAQRARPGSRRRLPPCGLLVAVLVAMMPVRASSAEQYDFARDSLYAAFVLNFAKFTSWPPTALPGPADPITLCIYGRSLADDAVAPLRDKSVQDHALDVRFVSTPPEVQVCNVIFAGHATSKTDLKAIIAYGMRTGTLTVSDVPGFADAGGHITLYETENRVRFRINLASLRRSGLVLSSKLLQLADVIGGQGDERP